MLDTDLTPFAKANPARPQFDTAGPWVAAGWMYATDGKLIVRVPAPRRADGPPAAGGAVRPPAAALFGTFDFAGRCTEPWPRGSLATVPDLWTPEGDPAVAAEDGGGGGGDDAYAEVGPYRIALEHHRLIAALPCVRFVPPNEAPTWSPAHPLRFAFSAGDGGMGHGLVMGMGKRG